MKHALPLHFRCSKTIATNQLLRIVPLLQQRIGTSHVGGRQILTPNFPVVLLQPFLQANQVIGGHISHAGQQINSVGPHPCLLQIIWCLTNIIPQIVLAAIHQLFGDGITEFQRLKKKMERVDGGEFRYLAAPWPEAETAIVQLTFPQLGNESGKALLVVGGVRGEGRVTHQAN